MTAPESNRQLFEHSSEAPLFEKGDIHATVVNRTHRVIRERANTQSAWRSRIKSLLIPLAVFSSILIIISTGIWTALAQNDLSPTGIPDASDQMLVFLLWFFPVSAALLATVWFKRTRTSSNAESMQ